MNAFSRLFCLFLMLSTTLSWGQNVQAPGQEKTDTGKAKFDSVVSSLKGDLFDAYLNLGGVLARQKASEAEIASAFEQAIRLDPKRELEEKDLPSELAEIFRRVRSQLVGCIFLTVAPAGAQVQGVKGDSVVFNQNAPIFLCDLVTEEYRIVMNKPGFEEQALTVQTKPGGVDTIAVVLKSSLVEKAKGGGRWRLVTAGGILSVAAAAVLYKTAFANDEGEGKKDLPRPPDRPQF
jgi:hypothetical protein